MTASERAEAQDCCDVRVVQLGSAGSECCSTFPRRFRSAKERQEALEKYREDLKNELAGVEERIQGLGK
jgi:hypothetical protein